MPPALTEIDPLALCAVGVAATALGLAGVVVGDWLAARRVGPWLAVLAVVAGGVAALVGLPAAGWAPPLALAVVYGAFRLVRSPLPGRAAALAWGLLQKPRLQWAGLLAAGPMLLGGWAYLAHQSFDEYQPDEGTLALSERLPLRPDTESVARTDRGRVIPLYLVVEELAPDVASLPDDTAYLSPRLPLRLIRTAPRSRDCNCHGWIFGGGRFWILGKDVATILKDNGYSPVEHPREGDLAIYRGGDGAVLHSALVRGAPGGVLLLESKWGQLGRYLHGPEDQVYGSGPTYYRSPRSGHQLRGLDGSTVPPEDEQPLPHGT
ncbi:MAG TPA: hypothetical protein VFA26_09715 [Gemmataceae bacterium]|nr:hypothetical protein [Gemmataceae bacterium]